MDSGSPRVRFAPSPTGYLHVGGARTALFNWLFARHHAGTFVLRIEDTDQVRSTEEMVRAIIEGLDWLGISHDEGPFFQSANRAEHVRQAMSLLEAGSAYRCFCSVEAIAGRRQRVEASGGAWTYDRACAAIDAAEAARRSGAGEPSCVRFRVPDGATAYTDLVHGETAFDNAAMEDLVLLRTDGTPTYNLSCVCDDIAMRITHVIRGDDHISNTPKQILLYRAIGAPLPVFGHLPLILGEDRRRLSKRHGAVSVIEYRRDGFLPRALFNFLALLGWSPGGDREIMTAKEMIEAFSFDGVGARSAVFDHAKLLWMNGEYIKALAGSGLADVARPWLDEAGLWRDDLAGPRRAWFEAVCDLIKDRSRTLPDLVRAARPFLAGDPEYDPEAAAKHLSGGETATRLESLARALGRIDPFDEATSEGALRDLARDLGVKAAALIHPARVALTGQAVSPGIFAVMALMGRDTVRRRLASAAAWARSSHPDAGGQSIKEGDPC